MLIIIKVSIFETLLYIFKWSRLPNSAALQWFSCINEPTLDNLLNMKESNIHSNYCWRLLNKHDILNIKWKNKN